MDTKIPNNIIPLLTPLKATSSITPKKSCSQKPSNGFKIQPPPSFQENKLLYIMVLGQISRLIAQLNSSEAEDKISSSDDQSSKQAIIEILILQLRIELIELQIKIRS